MIAKIRGILEARLADSALVIIGGSHGGVTLRVFASIMTLNSLPDVGQPVQLYTHLYMREDVLALYGFAGSEEQAMFEMLLTVSGIGPKAALAILSAARPDDLRAAIATGNVDLLRKIPGIGQKTAQRLIIDLKGKVDARVLGTAAPAGSLNAAASPDADLLAALTGLGYSVAESQAAIQSIPPDAPQDIESRLMLALRYFAR